LNWLLIKIVTLNPFNKSLHNNIQQREKKYLWSTFANHFISIWLCKKMRENHPYIHVENLLRCMKILVGFHKSFSTKEKEKRKSHSSSHHKHLLNENQMHAQNSPVPILKYHLCSCCVIFKLLITHIKNAVADMNKNKKKK
jgi:hypothetical protein